MQVLVVLCAALAVATCKPAAIGYAYSAAAPAIGYPFATHAYGYAPFAYSGAPAVAAPAVYSTPVAAPAVYSAPVAAPAVYAAPVAAPVVAPFAAAPVKSQYHAQDEFGQASYGHSEPTQSHNAVQDAAGNKVGSFSFVNPEGKVVRTDYVADAGGYRVASNDLPAASVEAPVAPADTPEVAAAKAAHFAEVAKASSQSRRKRAIAYPFAAYPYAGYPYAAYPHAYSAYPHAYPTTYTAPVVTADGYIADTPEVAAAKAVHFAEHAAAKARGKRAAPVITPAATTPLVAAPAPAYVAPYSPVAYSAYSAFPYSAYPYSAYPYSAYPYSAYPYSAYPYSAYYKK